MSSGILLPTLSQKMRKDGAPTSLLVPRSCGTRLWDMWAEKSGSGCLTDSPLSPIRFAIADTVSGRRGGCVNAQLNVHEECVKGDTLYLCRGYAAWFFKPAPFRGLTPTAQTNIALRAPESTTGMAAISRWSVSGIRMTPVRFSRSRRRRHISSVSGAAERERQATRWCKPRVDSRLRI